MTRLLLFLVHNWPLKLAAIVLATLLYGVIILTQDSRQFTGPIAIDARNQPAGLVVVSDLGEVRDIRYFATEEGIRADSSTFEAIADFSGVDPVAGTTVVRVTVRSIDPRISVLSYEPRQIRVTIDELVTREVPVRIVVAEPPEADLDVREPELSAPTVQVRGASADVARVDRAEGRVDIDPQGIDIDRDISVAPVDAQGERIPQVDVEPSFVHVRVAVFTNRQTRSVPVVPSTSGEPAPGFELASINVDPLFVTLEGDDEELRALTRAEAEPVVITGATDEVSQTVRLILPAGILAVGSDEVQVTVRFRQRTATRNFSAGIVLDGARSDLAYAVSTNAVVVTIGGSIADLDRLEGRSFTVEASVAGLDVGEHSVPVTVDLPAGLALVIANPARVTVTIAPGATPPPSASPGASPGDASPAPSP